MDQNVEEMEPETETTTMPRIKVASVAIKKGGAERRARHVDSFGREKKIAEEPESTSGSAADGGHQRNKRLFGALMGHLSQAKQNLDKDSTLIEKRMAVESKRVAKQEELGTTLCQLEKEMMESQRLKQSTQMRLDTLQLKKTEMVGVMDAWRAQTAPLAHVLMTETEPKLCWLPSTHNKTTQNLLDLRTAHVQEMIQTRETEEETVRAEIVAEIASLEAVLAASATNDDQNASEEEQMAASLTLSEYEARIKRRRAEREPITGQSPEERQGLKNMSWGDDDLRGSGGRGGETGVGYGRSVIHPSDLRENLQHRNRGRDAGHAGTSSSSDGMNRNGGGKNPSKSGQFAGKDLRELLGAKKSSGSVQEERERGGNRSHKLGEIGDDENDMGGGRKGRGTGTSSSSISISRHVRPSIDEDEEGEELDDKDRRKDDGKKADGGRDKEGEDKEEGGGSPVYWSEPAGAVSGTSRNDDSDEDVERYFEE